MPPLDLSPSPVHPTSRRFLLGDDIAYILPMAIWSIFTWAGGYWPAFYAVSYIAKFILTLLALLILRRHYTKICWNYWWIGAALGVIGVIQWIGMEKGVLHLWPNYPRPSAPVFNPTAAFATPMARWSFIAVRWAAASLIVPFMEELFWRDFLWRSIAAPADFKLARIGEWDRGIPLVVVSLLFCTVHVQWMTAIVWGLMIGALLITTRSLGACIIMHGVTNFLLGLYVLRWHDWWFW